MTWIFKKIFKKQTEQFEKMNKETLKNSPNEKQSINFNIKIKNSSEQNTTAKEIGQFGRGL